MASGSNPMESELSKQWKQYFLSELKEAGIVHVKWQSGVDMTSHMLTKNLPSASFEKHKQSFVTMDSCCYFEKEISKNGKHWLTKGECKNCEVCMLLGSVMLTLREPCTLYRISAHREIMCAWVEDVGERYVQACGSKALYKTIVWEIYVGECCMIRLHRDVLSQHKCPDLLGCSRD